MCRRKQEAVNIFIKRLSIIPIIGSVNKYAEIKVALRRKGKPVNDEFDLIIGVTALENKLTLVTDNEKNFKDIEGLAIENWYKR